MRATEDRVHGVTDRRKEYAPAGRLVLPTVNLNDQAGRVGGCEVINSLREQRE